MATPVEMPKLGNTVEECLLARWAKRAGDTVAEGELLAEIETDKATFELTAPLAGTVLGVFCSDGDLVPVYANVCVIGAPGEPFEQFRPERGAAPATAAQDVAAPATATEVRQAVAPGVSAPASTPGEAAHSPRARRFAATHNFYPSQVAGSGPGGRVLEEDLRRLYHSGPRATSLAGKMIAEGRRVRGGAAGEIRSSDLGPAAVKVSKLRELIAGRMRESLESTAQYTLTSSACATGLLALRARVKAGQERNGWPDININEMVMFCAVQALVRVPEVNVEYSDGHLYAGSGVHIGFACDTPKGLLVPVVKDAQKMTLAGFAGAVKELTKQATGGSISPDDLAGGTFTVSNLGMYGIESFTPILNAPQVAVLGVNAISLRPVRRDGAVEFVDYIGLSLTCDHQVIDGAPGARFLQAVREQIESIEAVAGLEG